MTSLLLLIMVQCGQNPTETAFLKVPEMVDKNKNYLSCRQSVTNCFQKYRHRHPRPVEMCGDEYVSKWHKGE